MIKSNTKSETLTPKNGLAVIAFHWSIVLTVVICFLSGHRIAKDRNLEQEINNKIDLLWDKALLQGTVFDWHIASGKLVGTFLLAYLIYIVFTGRFKYLLFNIHESFKSKQNKFVIWFGIFLLAIQCISGFILSQEHSSSFIMLANVHQFFSWVIAFYFLLHVISVIAAKHVKHLLSIVTFTTKNQSKKLWYACLALTVAFPFFLILFNTFGNTLYVAEAPSPPIIDGMLTDEAWELTQPIMINTRYGNTAKVISVEVRAVKDSERLYLAFRWPDKDKSINHLPLIKSKEGWRVESDGFLNDDERTFYEDKFAVMLSNTSKFSALQSIHLGANSIANAPEPRHQRGYHYTSFNETLDIWQWKAVRSNTLQQADDSYFGQKKLPLSCSPRYTAGYASDPSLSGGYAHNYDYFKDRYAETVTPLRLPKTLGLTADEPPIKTWMRWSDGDNYNFHLDKRIPIGTRIEGIIHKGNFEGDRGNVGAFGTWKNGYWNLEMSRALNSDSPFDTPIQSGTFIWVATFDHAQTRHSYHLWPLTLKWTEN